MFCCCSVVLLGTTHYQHQVLLVPCFPDEQYFASDIHTEAHAYTGLTAAEVTTA